MLSRLRLLQTDTLSSSTWELSSSRTWELLLSFQSIFGFCLKKWAPFTPQFNCSKVYNTGFSQTQISSLFKVKDVPLPLRKSKYKRNCSGSYHPLKDKVPPVSSPLSSLRRWSLQLSLAKTAACRGSHAWNIHQINKKPQNWSPNS